MLSVLLYQSGEKSWGYESFEQYSNYVFRFYSTWGLEVKKKTYNIISVKK